MPVSPYALQFSPEQQFVSAGPVQDAPKEVHANVPAPPPPHLSFIPSPVSGAHVWPLQHWSLNWQTWPGSMQHCGFAPS